MPFVNYTYLNPQDNALENKGWLDSVYKFTASSFYDWETDNLPIVDLEKRTDYLFGKMGKKLPETGVKLVVAPVGALPIEQPDKLRFFSSVQGAIDALPKVIDAPVIIEVARHGDLGTLNIDGFSFGPSGGIEIINRYFCGVSQKYNPSSLYIKANQINSTSPASESIPHINVSSNDIQDTIANTRLSTASYPAGNSAGWNNIGWNPPINTNDPSPIRSIAIFPENSTYSGVASLAKSNRDVFFNDGSLNVDFLNPTSNEYKFIMSPPTNFGSWWKGTYRNENSVPAETNFRHNSFFGSINGDNPPIVGYTYANYFTRVNISKCRGPIYLRGFFIEGQTNSFSNNTGFSTGVGISVNSCSNLILEQCSVSRFENGGCKVIDSTVTFVRGFTSVFNFGSSFDGSVHRRTNNGSCGLLAEDSNLFFSSVQNNEQNLTPADNLFLFSHNDIGIRTINSKIDTNYFQDWDINSDHFSFLQVCNNTDSGLDSHNSYLSINFRLVSFLNVNGVKANNSEIALADFTVDNNTLFGFKLIDSNLHYNKNYQNYLANSPQKYWARAEFNVEGNGQNIYLNNSIFSYSQEHVLSTGTSDFIGKFRICKNTLNDGISTLPSVFLESGSLLRLANLESYTLGNRTSNVGTQYSFSPYFDSFDGVGFLAGSKTLGSLFTVDSGSTLDLHGTKNGRTYLIGPSNAPKQRKISGIHADNNSKVYIAGPTTIAQFGVGININNGSILEVGPHKINGVIDRGLIFKQNEISNDINLCSGNHTDVEIHSIKSGIFADNSSKVYLVDLGDFNNFWDAVSLPNYNYNANNQLSLSDETSNGGIRFYANTPGTTNTQGLTLHPGATTGSNSVYSVSASYTFAGGFSFTPVENQSHFMLQDLSLTGTNEKEDRYLDFSRGGMCLTAQRGSNVVVKNVNFNGIHFNPSSAIIDEGKEDLKCSLIYGWAIDNDSSLNVSYCSVRGAEPSSVSFYNGPVAAYSGLCSNYGTNGVLSGAPINTPDTYNISVLDSFGPTLANIPASGPTVGGVSQYTINVGEGGVNTHKNKGPFRIFFTPTGKARYLGYAKNSAGVIGPNTHGGSFTAASVVYGEPYQLLAQGYNPPIDLSSSYATQLSSSFPDIGNASGFAYVKDYISSSYKDRIIFDQSALDVFANSRNALSGKSNRIPLLSLVVNNNNSTFTKVCDGGTPDNGKGLISLTNLDLDKEG